MLVLQQLFNLSDDEVELQGNDRRSFEEFGGLGVMNDIPDATTGHLEKSSFFEVPLSCKLIFSIAGVFMITIFPIGILSVNS